MAMLGALGVALVLGLLFARSFARPLQELTKAARAMAHGELEQKGEGYLAG